MYRQFSLVLLAFLIAGTLQSALSSTPKPISLEHDDIIQSNQLESAEEPLLPEHSSSGIKISTPKVKTETSSSTTSTTKSSAKKLLKPNGEVDPKEISAETLNDLIEASKHGIPLPFNLNASHVASNETSNKVISDENYYDYDDNDDYDDAEYNYNNEDTTSTTEAPTKKKSSPSNVNVNKKVEMKPIKEDEKPASKVKDAKKKSEEKEFEDDDDYLEEDDDDDDEDDDMADEEEIVYNENVPCPRYCVCARNVNSYLVATCSRFDAETQKFGSDITDLIVADVGPKYPIILGREFFVQMGLKHISSIKIFNCTIEFLHPQAFHGLEELYSVNLTDVGLTEINVNTFAKNKKLRLLTISGNDLSTMSNAHHLLNSSSIEELDLSRNNLNELHPKAFSQLSNIVYINLSQNSLQKLPEHIFDAVETIEELDLSYNSLTSLPPTIFNRTALAILHLKYNTITEDLHFGTEDLQQLDLSFNNLKQIHHGMFDKMTGLTNLNLRGNGITRIQADSFIALKNLRHIDLSVNELDQVSSMIFYKNSELDVIRLNDNPKLSQLPTDGFLASNGYFHAYYFDVSNCAIGALGHKTFSTMPHLTTLKLAWNNINNLERDTFVSLTKLIDLDLSNNLIARLDELIFMNNNELTKLNLAGNALQKLSVRLFLPFSKLRELDVSECELNSLLADNQYGVGRKYKFFETLRSFNASVNQIKRISSKDVKNFKHLRTLDISHNPLKCNEEFQDFISYMSLKTNTVNEKVPTMANLESAITFEDYRPAAVWAQLAHEVCRHQKPIANKKKVQSDELEKRIEDADKELEKDARSLWNIVENSKNYKQEILKDSGKEVKIEENKNNNDESELNNAEEDKDDDDDDDDSDEEDDYSDENDNDEDDDDNEDNNTVEPKLSDMMVKEIDLKKETNDTFLLNKFLPMGEDYIPEDREEEIIIERGHIYYTRQEFLIPSIIIITCTLVLLLMIAKIVSIVLRKRGERYRMALLASSNNSIVYQKLSEEIKPTIKEPKQPKVHRYTPINQV